MSKKHFIFFIPLVFFVILPLLNIVYKLIYPPLEGIECARELQKTIEENKNSYKNIIDYLDTMNTTHKKFSISRLKNSVYLNKESIISYDSLEKLKVKNIHYPILSDSLLIIEKFNKKLDLLQWAIKDEFVIPENVKQFMIHYELDYLFKNYLKEKHIIIYTKRFTNRRLVGSFKFYYFPDGYSTFKFNTIDFNKSNAKNVTWHFKIDSNWVVEKVPVENNSIYYPLFQ